MFSTTRKSLGSFSTEYLQECLDNWDQQDRATVGDFRHYYGSASEKVQGDEKHDFIVLDRSRYLRRELEAELLARK